LGYPEDWVTRRTGLPGGLGFPGGLQLPAGGLPRGIAPGSAAVSLPARDAGELNPGDPPLSLR